MFNINEHQKLKHKTSKRRTLDAEQAVARALLEQGNIEKDDKPLASKVPEVQLKQLIYFNADGKLAMAQTKAEYKAAERHIMECMKAAPPIDYFAELDLCEHRSAGLRVLGNVMMNNKNYYICFDREEHATFLTLNPFYPTMRERREKRHVLNAYMKECEHAEITVIVGEARFKCYLLLLQTYCELFRDISHSEVVLPLSLLSPICFKIIYQWMLVPEANIPPGQLMEVYHAANGLRMPELIDEILLHFHKTHKYTEECVFKFFISACAQQSYCLAYQLIPSIKYLFLPLVASGDYLQLNLKCVKMLLESDYIQVPNELFVLYSAVRWLQHDWEKRQKFVAEVLACVRFSLMKMDLLLSLQNGQHCLELSRILAHEAVKGIIEAALAYGAIEYTNKENDGAKEALLKTLNIEHVPPRDITLAVIFAAYLNVSAWSYEDFLHYLKLLCRKGVAAWNKFQEKTFSI